MIELTRRDARRLAVRAQALAGRRPTSVVDAVRALGCVRVDATAHVAPSAEIVLRGRIGRRFAPADLDRAIRERAVVELQGWLRPADEMDLYLADMAAWPGEGARDWKRVGAAWLQRNRDCADQIIETLRVDGPLPARDLPDCCQVPWRSSGWNNAKNTIMLLQQMEVCGEVAVSHRAGRERVWDLAERVYPALTPVPLEQAQRLRDQRRLGVLGIARATGPDCQDEPWGVGDAGLEARVDGVRGTWRIDETLLDQPFRGRTTLLSPFDRLIFDRRRMDELFEFDYALEMYKAPELRAFGYYALPILHGDRLVGTVDAEARRAEGVLRVHGVKYDEMPAAALAAAVASELVGLAGMLGLDLVHQDSSGRIEHRTW